MSTPQTALPPIQIIRRLGASETGLAIVALVGFLLLPVFVSGYSIYILPQYMLYGVMAMSLALLWGVGGILSIGQAGFFAFGGYIIGLCFKWIAIVNPAYAALLIAPAMGAALAAVLGYFLFRAGVRAAYFVLVTLAISIIVEASAETMNEPVCSVYARLGARGGCVMKATAALYVHDMEIPHARQHPH